VDTKVYRMNDFFCGCGGMGTGFKRAGFDIAGAWDFDKYAVKVYQENVWAGAKQAGDRLWEKRNFWYFSIWGWRWINS